jgi:hypothetical protein
MQIFNCVTIVPDMLCVERQNLLSELGETTRVYADSVRKMTDLLGMGIEFEVSQLRRTCRTAWDAVERARLALYRHEANHGCDRADFNASARVSSSAGG